MCVPAPYSNVLTVMDANVCSNHMGVITHTLTTYSLFILHIVDFPSYLMHIFGRGFGELLHLVWSKQRERKSKRNRGSKIKADSVLLLGLLAERTCSQATAGASSRQGQTERKCADVCVVCTSPITMTVCYQTHPFVKTNE